jgi:hypothetical protein
LAFCRAVASLRLTSTGILRAIFLPLRGQVLDVYFARA